MKLLTACLALIVLLSGCMSGGRTLVSLTPQRDYAIRETGQENVYLIITRDQDLRDTPNLDDAMDYLGCGPCALRLHLDGMLWEIQVFRP